ncbi:hypothetical protein XELAEV_18007091mg [Xenopus laevis]|uniref:Ig-like domain-containing protein n=1 Tax=Xenopus laevis TaxID=8355 RepID=A0A974I4N0_XENLA|nr:hypothetical protein XELAEV_18007091mg [Xenopus laevis]
MKIIFLFAVSFIHCVTSQISLMESGPGTVKPTTTLQLTCKVTGASLTDRTNMNGVHWVRQPAGKGLEWLGVLWFDATTKYATTVEERLTLSRDPNKGEVYFKLTEAKTEESATYYCARHTA